MKISARIEEITFRPGVDCTHIGASAHVKNLADEKFRRHKLISCWGHDGGLVTCNFVVTDDLTVK